MDKELECGWNWIVPSQLNKNLAGSYQATMAKANKLVCSNIKEKLITHFICMSLIKGSSIMFAPNSQNTLPDISYKIASNNWQQGCVYVTRLHFLQLSSSVFPFPTSPLKLHFPFKRITVHFNGFWQCR